MADQNKHVPEPSPDRGDGIYRQIFESSENGVAIYQPTAEGFVFRDLNPAGARITGVDRTEVIGREVREAFPGVEEMGLFEAFREVAETGQSRNVPMSYYEDGSLQSWFDNYIFRLPDGKIAAIFKDATKAKSVELALMESEERLKTVVTGGKVGFWDWDIPGNQVVYSDRWAEIIGYEVGELDMEYFSWGGRLHPEDKDAAEGAVFAHLEGQSPYFEDEHRLKHRDGSWIWVLGAGMVTRRSPQGEPERMSGIMLDISKRKDAERRLAESEARFRNVTLTTGDWLWEVDAQGRYTYASDSIKQLLGYSPEELSGKTPFDLMPPEEADRILGEFTDLVARQAPLRDLENWNLSKDGRLVCFLTNGVPIFDEEGELTGYFGVDKDITERKNTEAALRDRLKELTSLHLLGQRITASLSRSDLIEEALNALQDTLHPDFTTFYLTAGRELVPAGWRGGESEPVMDDDESFPLGECLCGLAAAEGKPIFSLDIGTDARCTRDQCKKAGVVSFGVVPLLVEDKLLGAVGMGSLTTRDFSLHREYLESLANVVATGLNNANLHEQLVVYADTLEERVRQRTAALREAHREAEEASRSKSEFLAKMSHEIRTPMNAVINMSELALMGELGDDQRAYIESVRSSGRHLLSLINDILDISKVEAGKLVVEEVDFDLGSTLRSTVDSLSYQAKAKGLFLTLNIDERLAPYVRGDQVRLQQIIVNLVGNAIKFTDRGGVVITVTSQPGPTSPEGEDEVELVFSVKDTGIGIPKSAQGSIFDSFSQADSTTTRRYGGSGLGLAITRQLVGLMGGDIWVESRSGMGATFTFTLRFKTGRSDQERQAGLGGQGTRIVGRPLNILMAEDNDQNVKVAQALMKKLGHRLTAAGNGQEALRLLAREAYDLVLMDLEMPVMDGLEATRRIRIGEAGEANKGIRIVALTAHALSGFREKSLAAGMNQYITKPFSFAEMTNLLGMVATDPDTRPDPTGIDREENLPILDMKSALDRFGGDERLYWEIAHGFGADFRSRKEEVLGLVRNGELEELARYLHTIKGNCSTIGAERCRRVAESLELAARAGDRGTVANRWEELLREVELVVTEMARLNG